MKIRALFKTIWSKEYIKKFVFCALLIIFAGVMLRLFFPRYLKIIILKGDIDSWVTGSIDAKVSGSVYTDTDIMGSVEVEPKSSFGFKINQ